MVTIARTKRYRELTYRHLKLIQLYSTMSELRLHTNKGLHVDTANYYHNKLYKWGYSASFLTASLESMTQVFYIELDGYIGAFWNTTRGNVQRRLNEEGSLAAYLYDRRRTIRKRKAVSVYESFLQEKATALSMIHGARGKLAHFVELAPRSKEFVPGDVDIREIINRLAEVLFHLGYQKGNKPHYIEQDDNSTRSTQKVIDKLVADDDEAGDIRKAYLEARSKWFGSSKT